MNNTFEMMFLNFMLLKLKKNRVLIEEMKIGGRIYYGVYEVCDCADCKRSKSYLVIAQEPAVAVDMLMSTTCNKNFLEEIKPLMRQYKSELN